MPNKDKQTFLVSGAASGIGKSMALALAERGHRLMLVDLDIVALEAFRKEQSWPADRIVTRKHDVRDPSGWERVIAETVDRFGALDVMLNIAGYLEPGYIEAVEPAAIDKQIDINVKGVMFATRAGAAQMIKQKRGHLVNIASIAGIAHVPGMSIYCASKHAVRGFTLSVAHELLAHGVHVSVLCPDAVETPMLTKQVGEEAAAMTFGGGKALSTDEVVRALFDILDKKPMEVVLAPSFTGRAGLAKLANAFPALGKLGVEQVRKRGRAVQAKRS